MWVNSYLCRSGLLLLAMIIFCQSTSIFCGPTRIPPQQSPSRGSSGPDPVTETLKLLQEGEEMIELRPDFRDLVLVVGNTGAGKTTLTKFLTNDQNMEAYTKGGTILIRDIEGKISTTSTIISKTIFPELYIHQATQTAFYDLPGFSDTRSEVIEIANAFFMKKIAEHAERIKFVFIVNHSSLIHGQDRNDIKTLITNAIDLIKTPRKFQNGIALIVSKVRDSSDDDEIIDSIGEFMEGVKEDIPKIIADEKALVKADNLVNAFIIPDEAGGYGRIGLFRQPNITGRLTDIPGMRTIRRRLQTLVMDDLKYVETAPGDFGFSISPSSRLLISNLGNRVNRNIGNSTKQLATKVEEYYSNFINSTADIQQVVEKVTQQYGILSKMIDTIKKSEDRQQFFDVLNQTLSTLEIDGIAKIGQELEQFQTHLKFFEQITETPIPARFNSWIRPLEEVTRTLQRNLLKVTQKLDDQLTFATVTIGNALINLIRDTVAQNTTDKRGLHANFITDFDTVSTLSTQILTSTNIREFVGDAVEGLSTLTLGMDPSTFVPLARLAFNISLDDGIDGQRFPFKVQVWVKPFEQLLLLLQREAMNLNIALSKNESEQNMAEMEGKMRNLTMDMERAARKQAERMQEEHRTKSRLLGNMTTLQEELKKFQETREQEKLAEQQEKLRIQKEMERQLAAEQKRRDEADKKMRERHEAQMAQLKAEWNRTETIRVQQERDRRLNETEIQKAQVEAAAKHQRELTAMVRKQDLEWTERLAKAVREQKAKEQEAIRKHQQSFENEIIKLRKEAEERETKRIKEEEQRRSNDLKDKKTREAEAAKKQAEMEEKFRKERAEWAKQEAKRIRDEEERRAEAARVQAAKDAEGARKHQQLLDSLRTTASTPQARKAKATLFPYKNFKGSPRTYDSGSDGNCKNLSKDWLESIHTQDTCITLYNNEGCQGPKVILAPFTDFHYDVRKLFVRNGFTDEGKSPRSVGPCVQS